MDTLGQVLIVAGCLLVFVSSIGLHRFPDVFARLHAAGKATSLGFALVVAGAISIGLPGRGWGELLVASVVLLLTTPVGVHMLARAAYWSGDQLAESTAVDELGAARAGQPGDS